MWWKEWSGMAYFEFPRREFVYEVGMSAVGPGKLVRLPEGTLVNLANTELHEVTEVSNNNTDQQVFDAKRVFHPFKPPEFLFEGDWLSLLWRLNAAATTNNLFHIYLTLAEYMRLSAGEWEHLLQLMSPDARELVQLHEHFYMDEQERPAIELLRYGRCP